VLSENLNYSAEALAAKFGRHRITLEQCQQFGRTAAHPADREAIANTLYGGEWGRINLGNTEPGDGYKFRGQGPIQVTGRANAAAVRDRLRVVLGTRVPDFEQHPEQLCTPEWGAWSAADFWLQRGLNKAADRGDVEAVTRAINGGLNGLDDRRARYDWALGVLA
jgi:putative chitinase